LRISRKLPSGLGRISKAECKDASINMSISYIGTIPASIFSSEAVRDTRRAQLDSEATTTSEAES
jgi:hypothetical protein